jgi:hypothetical protein
MKRIRVERMSYKLTYTIGKLYVSDDEKGGAWTYFCDTLEDRYRGDDMANKVKGKTAIPKGRYRGVVDYSQHFKKMMLHILGVPGFDGIRIHSGNTSEDTEGCILVGYNTDKGKLTKSRAACSKLMTFIKGENFEIEIN